MEEERYRFERVPEERRYWFLVQWGMPAKRKAEHERAEGVELKDIEELKDIDEEVTAETNLGIERERVREIRGLRERMDAVGYAPGLVSDPWWVDVEYRWIHSEGTEYLEAPRIFTTKAAAEEELRVLVEREPESYLDLIGRHEKSMVNEAFDNSAPLRTVWVDEDALLEGLRDADFLCVVVDGRLKLRQDFIDELLEEGEG